MAHLTRFLGSSFQPRSRKETERHPFRLRFNRDTSPQRVRVRPNPNDSINEDENLSENLHSILSLGNDDSDTEEEILRLDLGNPQQTPPSRSQAFASLFDDLFSSERARKPRVPPRFPGVTERDQDTESGKGFEPVREILNALTNAIRSNGGTEDILRSFAEEESSRTPVGWEAIHYASQKGSLQLVRSLLDKGAGIDATDSNGRTPLSYAAQGGHLELCQFLLEKGANVNAIDGRGVTPLLLAGLGGKRTIFELLMSKGANPESRIEDGSTILLLLAWRGCRNKDVGNLEICRFLVEHGCDVNAADENGITPLIATALWNGVELAELLLKNGANTNSRTVRGRSPLSMAAAESDPAMVKLLLDHGADPTTVENRGWNALHLCAQNEDENTLEVVRLILEAKGDFSVDVNTQEERGATPLYLAVQSKLADVVEVLLRAGANPELATANDTRPLELAVARGDLRMVDVLLTNGANINAVDKRGLSVLHVAVSQNIENNVAVVTRILEAGIDTEIKTTDGREIRAIQLAVQNDDEEIAMAMLAHGAQP
ncbi:ankyrin repeat-containing domain protein [Rhexocercosporidium sp. MPI-PUGE-AT-0058]|nr:ankyrin repeat-containing domain protein [Rhexocercosporidium sp. MPI-PUGE-AT-0058]